jgi:hypothetical protein
MMGWLRAIWEELIGLFVDDVGFAVAILAWVLVAGVGLPRLGLPAPVPAVVLFAGLAAILVESATRRARRR